MRIYFQFFVAIIGISFFQESALGQPCRYLNQVFPQTAKISDVVYANVPSIPAVYVSENVTTDIDLTMDIWQPVGDTLAKRPLIILAHGGGFISGSKDNNDMQYLADTFAHYGYVTASIDYRITLNALSTSSVERAIWRATQDGSAAIRFFKEKAELYGIDTNKVFVLGSSAGAFLLLSQLYVSDAERQQSTFSGFLQPDLGCKDCEGNTFNHSSKPNALVGCWGAIQDTGWISPSEYVPTIMFHGDADPVVPYNEGFPFSALFTAPLVFGSARMHDRLDNLNQAHEFYIGQGQLHEYWGVVNGAFPPGPITDPDYVDIIQKSAQFLYNVMGEPSCIPVGLNITDVNQILVKQSGKNLHFVNNSGNHQKLEIFSMEGKLLVSKVLFFGKTAIELDGISGLVIVKFGNQIQKVFVN